MQQVYKVVLFLTNGKLFEAVGECDNPTNETFCMISIQYFSHDCLQLEKQSAQI
jgi:hypothetical protein